MTENFDRVGIVRFFSRVSTREVNNTQVNLLRQPCTAVEVFWGHSQWLMGSMGVNPCLSIREAE